jgi:two-component system cell cycle sensor histidine kinase/response regulator CckA
MFKSLIQKISEIVVVIDPVGIVRFSNPQLQKVLELHGEDVIGQNIFDFIHPDDAHRAKLEFTETLQKPGEGVPSSLRIRDAGGEWIPFEIIGNNQIDDPDIKGVIFTARDLRFRREVNTAIRLANADVEKRVEERTTELAKSNAALRLENQSRRETERQLQETISLLNATLNSTADGILVVSRDGKVSGCNQRFFEMWHLPRAVGRDDAELLAAAANQLQDPEEFTAKVQALYSDLNATSFDVLQFKDGRIYERYSQPQRLGHRIVGRVWSFRDATEARRLEENLRQSQKLEALGRLAGGIAHDFNNLLMVMSGYLGRLSDCAFPPAQEEAYKQVLAATKRAATLTRQLLAFSRKHPDTPTVTNLNVAITNMQGMLRSLASDCIRLELSFDDDPVPILADVMQLEAVLMNLAINARDAMPNCGVLSVSTGRKEQDTQTFAVLTVSDTGRGMSPEAKARIFEPFFTTKGAGKGTGLGLSIVCENVKRLGGHIEVDSEQNRGTQFRVFLPKTTAEPIIDTLETSPAEPAQGCETILLAEDEAGIRAMTRAYLEGLGYHVLEAADGSEAVKVSGEYPGPIDLVLTDLLMPIIRGDAVVFSIREKRPGITALIMSGSLDDLVADKRDDVILKPFEFPELGRRVRSILDSHAAATRNSIPT